MICPQCQKEFDPRRHNQRFCCQHCKTTWTNRNRTLKPNVKGNCTVCGKSFERYIEPSKLKSGHATAEYCSRKCKGKALSGSRHHMWSGGRCVVNGYVWKYAPNHPHAKSQGYVLEHRLVMEANLGRHLTESEVVHHINGDTQDNRLENLQLFPNHSAHKRHEDGLRDRDSLGRYLPVEG